MRSLFVPALILCAMVGCAVEPTETSLGADAAPVIDDAVMPDSTLTAVCAPEDTPVARCTGLHGFPQVSCYSKSRGWYANRWGMQCTVPWFCVAIGNSAYCGKYAAE